MFDFIITRKNVPQIVIRNRVSEYREKHGFSVTALSSLIGTSDLTILNVEDGSLVPSIKLALLLSYALRCSVNDLFSLDIVD